MALVAGELSFFSGSSFPVYQGTIFEALLFIRTVNFRRGKPTKNISII
jgi:hypothetical protein